MTYQIPISRIAIKHIDLNDQTYNLLPFDNETVEGALTKNIIRCGILHPPIVKETDQGVYQIVAGWKRLQVAINHLKQTACDCLVLPESFQYIDAMAIALDETQTKSALSSIEQAIFFNKLISSSVSPKEAANRFLPIMGLKPHPYHITKLLQLIILEEPIAKAVHQGEISEKAAYELCKLSFRDRLALFDLISTLKLSVGNQRKIITICQDLAKRENSSILAVLNNPQINEIINYTEANTPQKATNLLKYLQEIHSPNLTAEQKKFTAFTSRLKLPKWVKIDHSKSFETNNFSLTISVNNYAELESCWNQISALEKILGN